MYIFVIYILLKIDIILLKIVLNFTVCVFDLGRLYGNVSSGKCRDNVWKRS